MFKKKQPVIAEPDTMNGDIFLSIAVAFLAIIAVNVVIKLVQYLKRTFASKPTTAKIRQVFPGAQTNDQLVETIRSSLEKFGFGENSLIATSLCCDEVNRPLDKALSETYGSYFSMGGLAGFPFGGLTSFGAMAAHIPDGGSCVVVYGPHVGVDSKGNVGTVERRGRQKGGSCCGSGVAAAGFVKSCLAGDAKPPGAPSDPLDAQQTFVNSMLLPHGARLNSAEEPMVELPYALFDAQDEFMRKIIEKGSGNVAGNGRIALLGGIQINTPADQPDYFLPLRFDVLSNKGETIEKIIDAPSRVTATKISSVFPNAVPNEKLLAKINSTLGCYGYGKNSLVATSLCCDEVNRPLEDDLKAAFGENFNMGGLAGFAFGGVTSFGAMAAHIPDSGSCLVVYGPHVGVDSNGKVGTVERRGRAKGGSCCGSGVAASMYVNAVRNGGEEAAPPTDPLDAQQSYVGNMLLPYGERLENAEDPMVELPYALFDAQDELMQKIVAKGCSNVAGNGKIALLGGIQINTPEGMADYFLPLRFDIRDNRGVVFDDFMA
ncbi:predicted protein [Phaeodactylum tricornutum CCAP 1055/1]|jgi:hypothetical protein|uniref:Limiting CO2-inducible protein B/C beta carbonyic anhydrase domain-containing protein n=2 Tax=Phaeodactylum tricornutum TaxID=2850 RepID=B7FR26_PHATC|nr:predicted protein [Phaeodactylum tricornutum CCAP 1055/1]EEC51968.1 predicted protein [Phaeodactylum tricornutum CCAP 1055/1]BAV00144.1 hypothetical protein [Phaeodactylum tricornutum]|eukprot:XP_002177505.1 predicted protein [Phaeodactylum tricornutum CCAP 1055/1]